MALWYDEIINDNLRLGLKVTKTLYTGKSEFQDIVIMETEGFGRALVLDGCWMTAEKEEKTYHEMIVHPALTTAKSIKRVLIIGGADGGTAREVLRHPEVEHLDLIEIDGVLVDACKEHLPAIGTSWDDPRLNIMICDGIDYVTNYKGEPYDIILVDGCDPVGPAEVLYKDAFFNHCKRILTPDGIFVSQCEDPHVFHDDHIRILRNLGHAFPHVHPYYAGVMLYPGNTWSWVYATQSDVDHLTPKPERLEYVTDKTQWYNKEIHRGAFAVPNLVRHALKENVEKS